MEPDELAALGVYDPSDPEAKGRLELLDYVTALGATAEELVTFKDSLHAGRRTRHPERPGPHARGGRRAVGIE